MARIRKNALDVRETAKVWKAAIYIRLSREDGNDESYSVTNQRRRLLTYVENELRDEQIEIVDFYVDDGCTGTDSERESFQRMLKDIAEAAVNCVIVKDLSRLSRNDWECKKYLQHLFVVNDVRFISLELPKLDSFRNPDEVYELGVSIQSLYNENHCRETSVKVRGVLDMKRRRGEFIGAFAPYGYRKDPSHKNRLLIDEEAAAVVRDIFHWFVAEGIGKNGIVKRLIRLGVPSPAAYKKLCGEKYQNPAVLRHGDPLWSGRSVTTILENQTYLGRMVQGKQKVKSYKVHTRVSTPQNEWYVVNGTHEAIIDEETFEKAKDMMRRDVRTAPKADRTYLFSGFLRCEDCGKAVVRRTSKGNVYYACGTNQSTGLCSRHSMRHDRLVGMTLETIAKQIDLIGDKEGIVGRIRAAPAKRNETERLLIALRFRGEELSKIKKLRSGLYIDWKNGDVTRKEYHDLKKELEEKESKLAQEVAALTREKENAAQDGSPNNPVFTAFIKRKNVENLDRGLVAEMIKIIRVREGGGITIEFTFADPHKCALS